MALNNRDKVTWHNELTKKQRQDTTQQELTNLDDRSKLWHVERMHQRKLKEEREYDALDQEIERKAYRRNMLEQEEKLAQELKELERKEICEIRERQRLRQNCDELRLLEQKLKKAYVTKELFTQIAEREEAKRLEKIHQEKIKKQLEEARVNDEERDRYLKEMAIKRKHEYKMELQDQMIYKDKMKRCKYEEFLREKKMIDRIVERLQLEDERALKEKWLQMQRTKEDIESFCKAQQIWRARQREQMELENKRIEEYFATKQDYHKIWAEKQKAKVQFKEEVRKKIGQHLYDEKVKKAERTDITEDLLEQERLEAEEQRHQNDMQKILEGRIDVVRHLDRQLEEREEKQRQIVEEDAAYERMLAAKIAEEEKLEMLTADRKRIRKMQIKKDLEDLIAERKQKNAENMRLLVKIQEQEEQEMAERQRKIEEERIRMLKEHAEHLIGYLPKGVLREEDLPLLGNDVYETYRKH